MAVARTTNRGNSWSRHILESSTTGSVYSLAVDPANSNVVYAAGHINLLPAVYKTTNAGATWSRCNNGITGAVNSIAVDPASPNVLYAGSVDGVHKSTNGGASWENVGAYGVRSVAVDPAQASTIYAGTSIGVYVSTNSGVDWFERNQGLPTRDILCVDKIAGSPFYAGTEGYCIYRWQDGSKVETDPSRPRSRADIQLFPNPGARAVTLEYALTRFHSVRISLYDRTGRLARAYSLGQKEAGLHKTTVDLQALPAGVYFVEVDAGAERAFVKLSVIR